MPAFVVAFALLLHAVFWGAGAAALLMPRRWRRFWPALIVPAGFALQAAVVWLGSQAGLRGTNTYAGWSLLLPVALLAAAGWRRGARQLLDDAGRFGVVGATAAGSLLLLVLPLALASSEPTTVSLGSCDAADYGAGARVLQEFAHSDREGFLGLSEVVQVHSVDNFYDYWLRLNHFTPSALIALNASVLHRAPHEIISLLTAVLLAGAVPGVFWMARAVIGYSAGASVLVAGLFGVSPLMWYAVAHVAPGQLLAAHAIMPLTWGGVALWRARLTWRLGAELAGVLAVGYWLLLGSYNFFLLVALVPVLAYAGGLAAWQRAGRRLARWSALMALPLAGVALLSADRVSGLAERLQLLQTYDFGWQIPALTAEGWLGMVRGPDLSAWSAFGLRWVLSAGVVGLLVWALLRAARQRHRALGIVLAILLPVLAGYLFLQIRAARLGTNASYDAYKLLAVFYPLLLPALCWWVTLRRSRLLHEWVLVAATAGILAGFNLVGCAMIGWHLSRPPLRVDPALVQLRELETRTDIRSVNLLFPDMWSRLWANAFLLRREQYFDTHTYEARLNTPLRGDWDLAGGVVTVQLPGDARRQLSPRFVLLDARHPLFVRVRLGDGWYPLESDPGLAAAWQWTGGDAVLEIENPHPESRRVRCRLDGRAFGPRELELRTEDGSAVSPAVHLGEERTQVELGVVHAPPGKSRWVLHSVQPATRAAPDDPRTVAVCVYGLTLSAGGH